MDAGPQFKETIVAGLVDATVVEPVHELNGNFLDTMRIDQLLKVLLK